MEVYIHVLARQSTPEFMSIVVCVPRKRARGGRVHCCHRDNIRMHGAARGGKSIHF